MKERSDALPRQGPLERATNSKWQWWATIKGNLWFIKGFIGFIKVIKGKYPVINGLLRVFTHHLWVIKGFYTSFILYYAGILPYEVTICYLDRY